MKIYLERFKKILLLFIVLPNAILYSQNTIYSNQDTLSLIAVGDIMMGTDFPRDLLPHDDGKRLLKDVEPILKSADITFGNLEGVLLDGGKPRKECKDTTTCYIFRTPTKFVKNLENAGFDVMSLSNNHSNDFGDIGRKMTRSSLIAEGIKYAGITGEISFIELKNVKIGIIAFSISDECYSILNIPKAKNEIQKLDGLCDVIIVSFHGGAEGEESKHVLGKNEFMFGEDRGNVLEFAHAVIDAGADLVIGSGPHVPRAIELYKDRFIAYSLGNFCTYKGFSIDRSKGIAPIVKVNFDKEGKFVNGKIISAIQVRPAGTILDKNNKAAKLIAELTKKDFPNSILKIDELGFIEKNK